MPTTHTPVTLVLLATAISFGATGYHAAGLQQTAPSPAPVALAAPVSPVPAAPLLVADAQAAPITTTALQEIHVDQDCRIRQDRSGGRAPIFRRDGAICHLESVHLSSHMVETLDSNGRRHHNVVTVAEQEYLLQDITTEPVAFVVEQPVPRRWKIDSDPQPTEMNGSVATFRVMAQPGQIVRLHVGEQGPI